MRACSVRATAFSATRWSFCATAPAMFWSRMVRSVARLRYTHAAGEHVGGLGVMASEVRS